MRGFQASSVALYLLGVGLIVAISIHVAGGGLFFTLDDPYIHFAVAENILNGGYGVNPGEYASPSSSILWPWLVSPLVLGGVAPWGALLVGVAASAATVWLLSGALWPTLAGEGVPLRDKPWSLLLTPWLIVSVNGFALPMTGMEHSLHVLASVLIVLGLVDLARHDRVTPALWGGILLSPLLRFEGFALAGAALAAIGCRRHWGAALGLAGALAGSLAAFTSWMTSLGLPALPSSTLAKSSVAAAALEAGGWAALARALAQLWASLDSRLGATFFLGSLVLIRAALPTDAGSRPSRGVVLPCVAGLAAHLAFGRNGWFGRYEVYAVAILLVAFLVSAAKESLAPLGFGTRLGFLTALFAFVGQDYLAVTLQTPAASRNVMQQQYQMHRFATEYFPHPVAVNDLGWVSYRNERYVLDLRGLASEAARRIALDGPGAAEAVRQLARSRGVVFAMVYDHWLGRAIPREWCRIAILRTSQVTSGSDRVSFYLADPRHLEEMTAALTGFGRTLPSGVDLSVLRCPVDGLQAPPGSPALPPPAAVRKGRGSSSR